MKKRLRKKSFDYQKKQIRVKEIQKRLRLPKGKPQIK